MRQRVENWDDALVQFANTHRNEDFEWGFTDCATLVRRALCVIYGRDIWEEVFPEYTTEAAARAVVATMDIDAAMAEAGGAYIRGVAAHSGDVMVSDEYVPNFCIVMPNGMALTSSESRGVFLFKLKNDSRRYSFWRF